VWPGTAAGAGPGAAACFAIADDLGIELLLTAGAHLLQQKQAGEPEYTDVAAAIDGRRAIADRDSDLTPAESGGA